MLLSQMLSRYRKAIMGLAAVWVVFLHCWLLIIPNRPVLGAIEAFVKWNGILGVEIFLFFSGLGLTYAIRKETLGTYYTGRFRRVLFPYWVVVLLRMMTSHWSPVRALCIASGVTAVTEDFQVLLWFVPAIVIFYALFPAYHKLMMRAKNSTAFTASALGLWLCAVILMRDVVREDLWVMINRVPSFLIGVWIGERCREKEVRMRAVHWALCAIVLAAGWMLRTAGSRGLVPLIPQFFLAASSLIGPALCVLLAGAFAWLMGGGLRRVFSPVLRILEFFGLFTLELYCIHQWLYEIIYAQLEGRVSYLAINVISIPVLILAGYLLYLLHGRVLALTDGKSRTKQA